MSHIKLHGVKPRIQYVANGTLTTYEFPFVIFTNTDIQVYLNDILQMPETYTVSGIKDTNGGSITFMAPPTNGTIITITRDLSIERTTDFQEGGALRADTLNDEFDYQTACLQQVADSINRSMILPPYATDTNVDLTLPTPSAGKAIVWNADGTNLENSAVKVNELESTLRAYKESAENASTVATEKATEATQQAQIATQKANEAIVTLDNKTNNDMTNLSMEGQSFIINLISPDYDSCIDQAWNIEHIAESDGLVIASCSSGENTGYAALIINNIEFKFSRITSFSVNDSLALPISKGDIYKGINGAFQSLIFCPYKGGINA